MKRLTAAQAKKRLLTYETEVYITVKDEIAGMKAAGQMQKWEYTLSNALDLVHEYLRQRACVIDAPVSDEKAPPAHGTPH